MPDEVDYKHNIVSLSDKEIIVFQMNGGTEVSSRKEPNRVLWSTLIILSTKDFRYYCMVLQNKEYHNTPLVHWA